MSIVPLATEETIGRYRVVARLGRGGMAEVFLGRFLGAGGFEKLFAIKRMLPAYSDDPTFVAMFQNEGRIAAGLSHPNVCQVYELGEHDTQLFLVMELLRGLPWSEIVTALPDSDPRMVARFVVGVLLQAAEGLHHAHTATDIDGQPLAIVHRDVSPTNLFVTTDGIAKILDFGVSKLLHHSTATRTGALKGKLPYMAPEQIRGESVDARGDLFSLGVVAWEALAGRSLFDRPSDFQIWKAVAEEEIPPLPNVAPFRALEPVILRALSRDAATRQRSVRVFAEELRRAIANVGDPLLPNEIRECMNTWLGSNVERRSRDLADIVSRLRGTKTPVPTTQLGDETRLYSPSPIADGARLRNVAISVDKPLVRRPTDDDPTTVEAAAPIEPTTIETRAPIEATTTEMATPIDPDNEETFELKRAQARESNPQTTPAQGQLTPGRVNITLPMPMPVPPAPVQTLQPLPGPMPRRSPAVTLAVTIGVLAVLAGVIAALIAR